MSHPNIGWIMACSQTTNFDVIINTYPKKFCKAHKGLCKGCALSPLVFLLAMDWLNHKIGNERAMGQFLGVKIKNIHISHLMFVDNLLFGGLNNIEEWRVLHYIINSFSAAPGLFMNKSKLLMISCDIEDPHCRDIFQLLGIFVVNLNEGFNYLGFRLKPNK